MEPFRLDQAASRGLTRDTLRTARYRRLGHGIYGEADQPLRLVDRVAAAPLVLPADAVVTGVPALHLHAVPTAASLAACQELDLVAAVAAGDWLVRTGQMTLAELRAAAEAARGRGCRRSRAAAGLVHS